MAGEDLVVTSGLDLAGLQRDFRRGIGLADQFVSDLQRTLASRELLGDLTPAGRRAGTSLARGLSDSLRGVGSDIARSLDLSSPIAQQGSEAGREFLSGLATGIGASDDILQRVAQSVDLSSGGERAGQQFTTGIARVISSEAPALRSAMGAAIVPTDVAANLGRLETSITSSLARLPAAFGRTGQASGAALVSGVASELTGARALIGAFSTETSRALTASLTLGDVSGTGERAGRLLATAVASGITAEAPRVRAALSAALVPTTFAGELSKVTGIFTAQGQEITAALGTAGRTGGQALISNLSAEVTRGAGVLKQLTAGSQIGVVVDAGPIRTLVAEQHKLLTATTATTQAMRGLDGATAAIDPAGIQQATAATRSLADAQRDWLKEAQGASVAAQGLWQRQRDEVAKLTAETKRSANSAKVSAAEEAAARKQVRAEIIHDIASLGQYGARVDATSRTARQAWLGEAQAIRRQAVEVGVAAQSLQKLDSIIDQTTASFLQQERAAQRAAAAIRTAGSTSPRFGPGVVDLSGFVRQTENAKRSITGVTIAGRSMQQVMGRLSSSAIAVGFGLESLARGGASADAGIRTALRSVASFAAFFGPKGLIVAGAAAASAAIIDLFSKSRDEMKKTREDFEQNINTMVKSADTIGLQKELRDIQLGVPTRLEDGTVELRGGLQLLQRELAAAEEAQRKAFAGQGGSIFKTGQDVKRLTADVAAQQKVYDSLVRTILTLTTAGSDPALRKPFNITASTTGAKEAQEAIKLLGEEVRRLSTTYQQVAGTAQLQLPVTDALVAVHERITELLKGQEGATTDVAVAYREMLSSLQEIEGVELRLFQKRLGATGIPTLPKAEVTALVTDFDTAPQARIEIPAIDLDSRQFSDALKRALSQAGQAQNAVDFSRIFGSTEAQAAATKGFRVALAELERQVQSSAIAIALSSDTDEEKRARLQALISAAQQAAREFKGLDGASIDAATNGARFVSSLRDVSSAAFGIANAADSMRLFGQQTTNAIRAVGNLVDAVGNFSDLASSVKQDTGKGLFSTFGNFVKSIPVLADIAGTIVEAWEKVITALSSADEHAANREIARQNIEAIRGLSAELAGFSTRVIGQNLAASRAIESSALIAARKLTSGFGRGLKNLDILDSELKAAGTSIADLKLRAEELGITIVDAKGRISAEGLNALNKALLLTARAAANFEDSLQSLQFIQRAKRDIFDLSEPTEVFNDALAQIERFAPEIFRKFFTGIDVSSASGRKAAEDAIRRAFEFATDRGIDLTPFLTGFESVEQFIETLLDADGALDTWSDAIRDLTSETVNAVEGFRDWNRARAIFQAQEQRIRGPQVTMPPRPGPTSIPVSGTSATTTVGSLTFAPTIVLRDVGTKDIPTLTSEIVADLKRKANAIADPRVKATVNLLPA